MRAEIVSIGTELLMGETVDTNSTYLATELAKLGVDLRWVTKVGDDPGRLFEALERAWTRSDVTLTSGGLGPTSDDLTRESIAQVFGEEMTVQDEMLKHLRGLFAGRGTPMPETNVKQATLIPSAEAIPNPIGTAPGWWAEKNGHVIVAMPGPPREIQRMWSYEVAPRLKAMNPDVAIVTRTLKTFGISEGGLDEMLTPLFKSENPLLGIYSKQDGIHLRAIATAPTEDEARRLIVPMEREIRRAVGDDAIWGEDDDTPESMTAAVLGQRGLTLGIMESFTGGLLASNLAEVEGSRGFLLGSAVVYRDELLEGHGVDAGLIEEFGPVHERVAEDMARAARKLFDADVGLAVTGIANSPGPDSQGQRAGVAIGTTWVGFATKDGVGSIPGSYPSSRLRIRSRAVTHALLGLIRFLSD
ncbi:MAG: CinA family nicotinamide mononucleotide deamidase-related protein [Chloroflexi bacterium]|nr:CinA family nicotinamide mononucleotide deamidase-related protein [Chloroflexota bacterium]